MVKRGGRGKQNLQSTKANSPEFPGSLVGKEAAFSAGDPGLIPGSGRFAGQEIGYSPWGLKESDMTERLSLQFHFQGKLDHTIPGNFRNKLAWVFLRNLHTVLHSDSIKLHSRHSNKYVWNLEKKVIQMNIFAKQE